MFVYFEKERERAEQGEGQSRERIASKLHSVIMESHVELDLTNHEIMTSAKIKSRLLN